MKTLLRVLGVLLVTSVSCNNKPELSFELSVPGSVSKETVWFEIGAFKGPDLVQAIKGHVLQQASITGVYAINPAVKV